MFCFASPAKNPMQDGNALNRGLWSGGEHCFQRTIAKRLSLDRSCAVLWGMWINDIPFSPAVPKPRPKGNLVTISVGPLPSLHSWQQLPD